MIFKSVGRLLGMSKDEPVQFDVNQPLSRYNTALDSLEQFRDSRVAQNESAKTAIADLRAQRQQSAADLQGGAQGRLGGALDALAAQGGLDSGARERLAMQNQEDVTNSQLGLFAAMDRDIANISAADFAQEEAERAQARLAIPQLTTFGASMGVKGGLGNLAAQQAQQANDQAMLGGLAGIGGTAIGYSLGGPIGAMIGGGLGKSLFS